MRKNRNSFFTESNMNYANLQNPGMIPPQNIPYQASTNFNSFYTGPGANMPNYDPSSNIENRLAKIERQINRLEHRINKLESVNTTFIENDIDSSGNMYML